MGKAHIDENSPFVKAYKVAGYKEFYEATGPYAYDAVNLIIEALKKSGLDEQKSWPKPFGTPNIMESWGPRNSTASGRPFPEG